MKKTNNDEVFFPEKWAKIIKQLPEFKDTADAASPEDLKKTIVLSEGNIYTVQKELAADEKLNGAKAIVKDLTEPYRDAVKVQKAKIQYALFLLEGKGLEVGDKEE